MVKKSKELRCVSLQYTQIVTSLCVHTEYSSKCSTLHLGLLVLEIAIIAKKIQNIPYTWKKILSY